MVASLSSRSVRASGATAAASSGDGTQDLAATTDPNRWEILTAAAKAFMEHGYAATSIDTVAAVLGATKGRIYYCYKSKADLFFDIHREAMLLNLSVIRPIATGPGTASERLRRMVGAHLDLVVSHLPLQRVSIQGVEMHLTSSTTPEQRRLLESLIAMRDEYERMFSSVLTQGVRGGEFRDFDVRLVVKLLLGSLNWATVWYRPRTNETAKTRRKIIDEGTAFVLQAVRQA